MPQQRYNDFGSWLRVQFPFKVQKLSVDAGFTCPNRDGSIGKGGCIYCNNTTFRPSYINPINSLREQIEQGKAFFARKYKDMKYLAYFQSYTSTYGSIDNLIAMYEEALRCEDVVGLVVGTRPDCMPDELLNYFSELSKHTFLIIEYGVESTNNTTLNLINRHHTFECAQETIRKTHDRGIRIGAHVILGLPGEDEKESIRQAEVISSLPIDILKMHQMQIIKGTRLAEMFAEKPFHVYTADEYIQLTAEYIRHLRKDLILERFVSQSPKDLLIAPDWGLKNYEFTNKLTAYLEKNDVRQGDKA